jgi:nitrogen fixation NifU-like protein
MEFWLSIKEGIICDIKFWTDGCETTIAAGSIATILAKDKSVGEAFKISQQDVLDALDGLPEDSQHCALLAANTLKAALSDYLVFKNDPWKRIYHKNTAIY